MFKKAAPVVLFVFLLIAIPLSIYFLVQYGILPTSKGLLTQTPSPTPSPIATPQCVPRPECLDAASPCLIPEPLNGWCPPTITPPTASSPSTNVTITVQVQLPGIGPSGNTNPTTASQSAEISLYHADSNVLLKTTSGTLTFAGTNFSGDITISNVQQGSYLVKIKFPNTLQKLIPGILTIRENQTYDLAQVSLIPGDMNADNILDEGDVTIFLSCFADQPCAQKNLSDFNDDSIVDGIDYNILLRSFTITRKGD